MDNKKYLDKVLDHLVRGTKIDYEKGVIIFPFFNSFTPYPISPSTSFFLLHPPFVKYCKKHFGLIDDEVKYVYHRYVKIIEEKI